MSAERLHILGIGFGRWCELLGGWEVTIEDESDSPSKFVMYYCCLLVRLGTRFPSLKTLMLNVKWLKSMDDMRRYEELKNHMAT